MKSNGKCSTSQDKSTQCSKQLFGHLQTAYNSIESRSIVFISKMNIDNNVYFITSTTVETKLSAIIAMFVYLYYYNMNIKL